MRRHRPPGPAAGCISAGETAPRITDSVMAGKQTGKVQTKRRISPRMVQAGNANRRDNPYDRKIRPMETYPVQADGLSVYGNFGVFACTDICLKILLILQTVNVSVILPLSLTSCKTWSAIFNNKNSIHASVCQVSHYGNRGNLTLPAKSTDRNLLRS